MEINRTIAKVATLYIAINNTVYQVADALLGVLVQRTRCRLYPISNHQDSLLTGEGVRARI